MTTDCFNLRRFLEAQAGAYPVALSELQCGRKRSHWIWYIFPQLKHLGFSYNSKFYGISGLDEARAYLSHPVLGERLRRVSSVLLGLSGSNAREVLGGDDIKLRSSMTLFDVAAPNDVFARVLEKYFHGQRDAETFRILSSQGMCRE